ncbi:MULTISPECIES: pyridoxal-dependent decarboxylase [unclassified Moorena]|uniref:pyridoxal phosphate-dependent decarboxylase family protein n=1 Tax=unclassified Moorena TaxID=2683338 RepID=UPI0013FFDB96|nr:MULTISPECIES: pyridoxal-dependent decarboxylase [unclassified Moorena]NEO11997.1 decarboxylase [Moorena sp. SIO3E8]NEP97524.1 decarboxylase [Moorena sp. SIO3F7]
MKKLSIDLTPDYSGKALSNLKKSIGKLLGYRSIPELASKKRIVSQTLQDLLGGENETEREVAAWFIGPRGENVDLFSELILLAVNDHVFWRRNFHPSDPSPITETMKQEPGYVQAVDTIKTELYSMLAELKKSAPFFSMRYQGHMNWDQTLPGMVGYVAAMLYNQNNVALEASPITTLFEVEAMRDLCRMFGYGATNPQSWGHLTCGGSTANIESIWAARNLKFYPLSFKEALNDLDPKLADKFKVNLPSGKSKKIHKLDTWDLLNLSVDEVLNLSNRLIEEYNVDPVAFNDALSPYSLQNMGFLDFAQKFLVGTGVGDPVVIVPASKHYSLPKGAAILGLGANNMHTLPLDVYGRMDVAELEEAIDEYIASKHPIISVVSIFGTTEEGNVDPLADVVKLRDQKYRPANVDFALHADCAWGGYFASLLWDNLDDPEDKPLPPLPLSDYVIEQYQHLKHTDTITVDPHKTGYLPYPAGGLCYRNMAMRSLIAFEAPYINSGGATTEEELVLGTYGIEGSKPGAAAAGVYLSHAAIRPTRQGYGKILGRTLYNCKVFHWKLLEYSEKETDFVVVPTPKIELERIPLLKKLSGKTPQSIINDPTGDDFDALRQVGSDLNILTYAFNYKVNGVLNDNLDQVNQFNEKIYDRMSIKTDGRDIYNYEIIVSTTDFLKYSYGDVFFNDYKERLLGLPQGTGNNDHDKEISVLRSVIMDPWITEDVDGKPFVDYIVAKLFDIVREVVAEMQS